MQIPSTFGKFHIEREVGRGGFAVVYQAVDPTLDRRVAIKVPHAWLAADPRFVDRFRREARVAASLVHPHIVTIHEIGEAGGTPFIATEWLEGMPLDQWLAAVRPPPQVVLQALVGVGAALDMAHAKGVVHRDIKPSNIMMAAGRGGVLTDFGIARLLQQATQTTTGVMGTPTYMAPEQLKGEPASAATDMYALGVLLYEVLAGRPPFQAETPTAVAYMHATQAPPDPRSINPALPKPTATLLLQALAKDARQRPVGAEKLIRALLAGLGVGAQGASARPVAAPRLPAPALTILVAAVAITAVLFFGWAVPSRPGPPATPTSGVAANDPDDEVPTNTPTRPATALPVAVSPSSPTPLPAGSPTLTHTPTSAATPTSTPIPTLTPTATTAVAAFVVEASVVNVRAGPGTVHPSLGRLQRGQRFEITGRNQKSDWWEFDFGGRAAWVAASLVSANVTSLEVDVAAVIPTAPAPTPLPAVRHTMVSLAGVANNNTTGGYTSPPLGVVDFGNVPFDLGQGEVFISQAITLPNNPRSVRVGTNVIGPQAVYLLITGGNLYERYHDQVVGRVVLHFSGGLSHTTELVAGHNLREWKQGAGVVRSTTSPEVMQVWAGSNRHDSNTAIIDRLRISVPLQYQSSTLVAVEVIDSSLERLGEMDPAFNLLGITAVGS